ncbi:MAG: hypothetical protein AB1403_02025 [Candidatus Riflebacteria bacterium]
MKKFFLSIIAVLLIFIVQSAMAAEKFITAAEKTVSILYTKPYDARERALNSDSFIKDLVYPDLSMAITAYIRIPQKTILRKEVQIHLDSILKNHNNPDTYFEKIGLDLLNSFIKDMEEKHLPEAANVFSQTSALTPEDLKKREDAVKKLNLELMNMLKGIDKNKAYVEAAKNLKAAIIKDLKTNKTTHTTILGLDVAFGIKILYEELPAARSGFLSRFANINTARESFFSRLPRFSMINNHDRSKFPRVPIMIPLDFPSPYIQFPDFPDIKALLELPANVSNDQYFHIFHSFVLRDYFDGEFKVFLNEKDNTKRKGIYGLFNKVSQDYAEKLLSKKDFSGSSFKSLSDKFTIDLVLLKAEIADAIKKSCHKAIEEQNPQVKFSVAFVEDSDYGYQIPQESTSITLADPETLDYSQYVDRSLINSELKFLAEDVLISSEELDQFIRKGAVIAADFCAFFKTRKPVKNSDIASFLQEPLLNKHLKAISLLDQERSERLNKNLKKLETISQHAKKLWLMGDIFTYNNPKEVNFDGQALKNILIQILHLQYIWKNTRTFSFDINLPLRGLLSDISLANDKNQTQGYDFLQKWAFSLDGTFKELDRLSGAWNKSGHFQDQVKTFTGN